MVGRRYQKPIASIAVGLTLVLVSLASMPERALAKKPPKKLLNADIVAIAHQLPPKLQAPVEQAMVAGDVKRVNKLLQPSPDDVEPLLTPAQQYYLLSVAGSYQDKPAGSSWLQRAALLGLPLAQYEWATLLINGGRGVDKAPLKAGRWLIKAANHNHQDAQLMVAMAYEEGRYGLPQDLAKAVMYYRKGALSDDPLAQYALAYLYEEGHGIEADLPLAFHWYQQAAEQGLTAAQYKLGLFYLSESEATGKDLAKSKFWLEKAANQGYVDAQLQLGLLFEEGELVGQGNHQAQALHWYKQAALEGDAHGQMAVGTFYLMGWGTHEDTAEAYKWFKASADQGNDDAQNWVMIIEQELADGMVEE